MQHHLTQKCEVERFVFSCSEKGAKRAIWLHQSKEMLKYSHFTVDYMLAKYIRDGTDAFAGNL